MATESPEPATADRPSSDEPLLRATGLKKYFETETGIVSQLFGEPTHVKAVDGVDLAVGRQ